MPRSQIVAMGGGGFSDDDPLLDDYILELTSPAKPKVCFVPTASGDADGYVARFYRAFPSSRAHATDLPLFARSGADVREVILAQDVVYVGGGNTANMLALWRLHGVDAALREAWERGIVLCGISAGGMCWFEASVTDSFGPQLAPLHDGLGLLAGSFCPHYDSEERRRPVYHDLIDGGFPAGYAADDAAGVRFEGMQLVEAVASRADARVYRVERGADGVVETPLETRFLG